MTFKTVTSMVQRFFLAAALGVLAAFGSGCDFDAAGDAFDEFDVIIGLEPIDTIVNGVVVDASTGELVDARLTFSGADANAVIDAYSDPVGEVNAEGGTMTFGIANGTMPSPGAPVELTILIESDGYFDRKRSLVITEQGDAQFQANMVPVNIGSPSVTLPGTDVDGDQSTTSDASTGLTQSLSIDVQTPFAEALLSVPQHAIPFDGSGSPLAGTLTTAVRVFDGSSGLKSLPSGALEGADGSQLSVAMAVFFRMVDSSGRVAVGFNPPPVGKASKSATACEDAGGTSLLLTSSEPSFVTAVQAAGGSAVVDLFAFTPADGVNNVVGSVDVTLASGVVSGVICMGGALENVDSSLIGDASDGFFYTFALSGASVSTGTLDHTVNITNPNGSSKQVTFSLVGPGFLESASTTVPSGPSTAQPLSSLVGQGGAVSIVSGADYVLSATLSTGQTTIITISDPFSGSSSLTLPESTTLETFDLVASLSCADPVNQEFEVQITTESLDAISVFYREDLPGNSWTLLPRNATEKIATDASIEISATIDLKPSTTYRVRGTLADNSAETIEMTPPSGGSWTVTMGTDEIGLDCSDR